MRCEESGFYKPLSGPDTLACCPESGEHTGHGRMNRGRDYQAGDSSRVPKEVAMTTTSVRPFADATVLASAAQEMVGLLQARPNGAGPVVVAFDRLGALIGGLPLTTDEFCFATNWLSSARQYWEAGELGAALY